MLHTYGSNHSLLSQRLNEEKSCASNTLKQTCWMVSFQSDYIIVHGDLNTWNRWLQNSKLNFKMMAEMSLQEKKIKPRHLCLTGLYSWVISARHKNGRYIFYFHQLHLAHMITGDWYERSSGFYSTGMAPPSLGLTFKHRSQNYHTYNKLTRWNFGYALKAEYLVICNQR